MNVPKLRFPGFQGEWVEKRLGNEVFVNSKKYNPAFEQINFKCIELEHIESETGRLLGYTDSLSAGSIKNVFKTGDVLFGKLRPYLRKYHQATFNGVCSSEIWVLKSSTMSNDVLFQLVQTEKFINITNISSGSKMPRADWELVADTIFSLPSLPEQEKIAEFLSSVDNVIQLLTKKKTLLEDYKKGIMQKIFSQEIRFKDDDGNDFPEWEEKRLGEVAEIIGGGTPDTSNSEYWDGKIVWLTPTEIKQKYISHSHRKITEEALKQSSAKLLPKGTILFTSRATIGDLAIAEIECTTNQGFQSFVVNDTCDNEFLYYLLAISKEVFIQKASGSTFLEISKTEILKILFPLPALPEQQKIADFLSGIDRSIEIVNSQIEKAKEYKKGLLQKMFV